jgi:prevent-host-death family protein
VAKIMATTTVGVRELKNDAPRLVQRAARGERILITRYGRPHAVLGPVVDSPGRAQDGHRARMAAWQGERRAFERLIPRLRGRFEGRHVAIHGGRVVGSDTDHNRLFERIWKKLKGRTFFIGRVGGETPTVEIPGFEVE